MFQSISFKKWLYGGVAIEILIFLLCFYSFSDLNEVFRYAARYSGRFSLIVYLFCFGYFSFNYTAFHGESKNDVKNLITVFCILHFIHFFFLATNVYLNKIELVPYRLAGGFLAYLLILIYPFYIDKPKTPKISHLIYFYYVGFIMFMTYLGRIKDGFQGASPSNFHYFGLASSVVAFLAFGFIIFKKKQI